MPPILPFILIFLGTLVGLLVYLIPTFVAFHREHERKLPIFAVNFFTGWSVVGWIACLVWALRD